MGCAVGIPREGVRVTRSTAPYVRVGRRQDDVVGIGPVIVQALPDAARTFRDVGLRSAEVMYLEIPIAAVAKERRATRPEVGKPRDLLSRPQGRCLVEVNSCVRHCRSPCVEH